jgi:hypothetical protein
MPGAFRYKFQTHPRRKMWESNLDLLMLEVTNKYTHTAGFMAIIVIIQFGVKIAYRTATPNSFYGQNSPFEVK